MGDTQTIEHECVDCAHDAEHFGATGGDVTDKTWDGSASRFTDAQYKTACAACDAESGDTGNTVKALCFLPHHEPDGTINSNGVHSAAQRMSSLKGHDATAVKKAAAHLRSHYSKDLKEDPPDSITALLDRVDALADQVLAGTMTAEEMCRTHAFYRFAHPRTLSHGRSRGGRSPRTRAQP
jgi:hypothetical protein